ncbi:MAG TPA: helicase HerA-like domain-containing protein [Candidatus Nanopelagicales bacterium]|nr:helicase HerA-like domain-containing protein [Candidatus Nanopelagicales bacterium]
MADLLLGGRIDPATGDRTPDRTTVASADLTTHGVIVGMTGSGKTGLGVVLIEECLAAGVPTILIDPKGDLTNLLLIFPELRGTDFRPWVNEGDAQKAGVDMDAFAEQQATSWRDGLAGWEIAPERLAELRAKVDFTIYTPGSSSGRPLNIVGSLAAPKAGTDTEVVADEIDSYATSLLGMVGISGDPLSSREHILLANLIQNAWAQGQDLDIATLIGQVQSPPIRKLGVLELDAFFPPNDRMAFAMKLNGLLASPSFATWLTGDPIDIDAMLRTPDGRPRCAVVTTAHLDDEQRQSVTSLVLAKLVTWMRRQSGTSDLRALLYMDEVAGYLPPTANPPTKKPIMLLLKQARAFGLGVVLATQNPVDVDYKALSNSGTWLIGRLQTEQDKARLVDGLSSAAGGVDVKAVADTIGNLGKRQFLLRKAGKDVPEVMTTRWAMSYLRGPLTRDQIGEALALSSPSSAPSAATVPAPASAGATPAPLPAPAAEAAPVAPVPLSVPPATAGADESPVMPSIAAGVPVAYVDPAAPWLPAVGGVSGGKHLRAAAVARVDLTFDEGTDVVASEEFEAVLMPLAQVPDPRQFVAVDYDDRDLVTTAPAGAVYGLVPSEAKAKTYWNAMQKSLVDELVRSRTTEVMVNADLKAMARPGETREQFVARCHTLVDAAADKELTSLRSKYETKLTSARVKLSDAQINAQVLQQQYDADYGLAATSISVLGGLLGGRRSRSSMASQAKRQSSANAKVGAAETKATALQRAVADLEAELQTELLEVDARWNAKAENVTTTSIPLEKSDVVVRDFRLVWIPVS